MLMAQLSISEELDVPLWQRRLPWQTARLLLRPVKVSDAERLFKAVAGDASVARFMRWRPHQNVLETRQYITKCVDAAPEESITLALLDQTECTLLGAVTLRLLDKRNAEIGFALGKDWWGQGLMALLVC